MYKWAFYTFFFGLTLLSSFSLDHRCAQWLKSGLEKCECVLLRILIQLSLSPFMWQTFMKSVLVFLSVRCLWTHVGSKHGTQKRPPVWGQAQSDAVDGEAAVSWSPGQIRLVLPAAVYNWPDWSLLLGGGLGNRSWYRSDLPWTQAERSPRWQPAWLERQILESGAHW